MSKAETKLTLPQRELLRYLGRYGSQRVTKKYSTAFVLNRLGLLTIEDVPPPYGWKLTITDLGRSHPAARS